jgi:hypothetical protein
VEKDSINGSKMITYLAMIAASVGHKDLAGEQLAIVVRSPGDLSYGNLKLLPLGDPLRGDRRFPRAEGRVKEVIAVRCGCVTLSTCRFW